MQEKTRIVNSQHQIDAILAVAQVQNLDKVQAHVLCVVDTVKYVLAKDFLQFNKHVHNVRAQENKLQIHAQVVEVKVKNKQASAFL